MAGRLASSQTSWEGCSGYQKHCRWHWPPDSPSLSRTCCYLAHQNLWVFTGAWSYRGKVDSLVQIKLMTGILFSRDVIRSIRQTIQAQKNVDWMCYFHVILIFLSSPQPTKASQQSYQELVLSEDEKRLLAKEGTALPSQFPLTKVQNPQLAVIP